MNKYVKEILSDCKGRLSSKRTVGIISALSLIIAMFIWHNDTLFNIVMALALGGLSLTSAEKIFSKDESKKEDKDEEK